MIVIDRDRDELIVKIHAAAGEEFSSSVRRLKNAGFRFDGKRKVWRSTASRASLSLLLGAFSQEEIAYLRSYEELVGAEEKIFVKEAGLSDIDLSNFKKLLSGELKLDLFPYQWEGAAFLYYKGRALLSDEMGLGKTCQIVAAVLAGLKEGKFSRVVIICPAHLKQQWRAEFLKFSYIEPVVVDGDREKREKIYASLGEEFVAVVGYETIRQADKWDLGKILKLKPDCLVCDEIHHAKDRTTLTARALRAFKNVSHKFLATGTPFQKHAEDVYSIFEILDKEILGSLKGFREKYVVSRFNGRYTEIIGYRNLGELHRRISPYMVRRRKVDVGLQLPEKLVQTILVDMTEEQQVLHSRIMNDLKLALEELEEAEGRKKLELENRVKVYFNFLQEIADCPGLLAQSQSREAKKYAGSARSPKLELLKDIVDEKVASGEKVVVFTKYRRFLDMIVRSLSSYAPLVIHSGISDNCQTKQSSCLKCGAVKVCNSRRRAQELFNKGDCMVLVCTDAAQEGVNLQGGSTLIHVDVLWNPAAMDQRSDRIHRADSEHERVHIIQLVSAGSVEERMLSRLAQRRAAGRSIVDGIRDLVKEV